MQKTEKHKLQREFLMLIRDILHTPEFKQMKHYRSHVRSTLYRHSVKVAYLCFLHHKRWKMKIDIAEFVRGALLHDFFLYDLKNVGKGYLWHWFRHPHISLENALAKYPTITEVQRDMIGNHMFPVTPKPPRTKAGWLVCFYDKIAATSDRFGKGRRSFFYEKTRYNILQTFKKQNKKGGAVK